MKLDIRKKSLLLIFITAMACDPSSKPRNTPSSKIQHIPGPVDPNIDKLVGLDVELAKPRPGDWLWSHNEPGQSFSQYIKSGPVTSSKDQDKFYLLPIGNFSGAQESVIEYTADYLRVFFDRETIVLPGIDDSFIPLEARRRLSDDHEQFKTGVILDYLQEHIPPDAIAIMAFTSNDLYPDEAWNFVFGQARLKQRVGVSSLYWYCDSSTNSTQDVNCLARIIKTSSHEMGHMLSCQHCIHAVCVMNGSNSLRESDSRPNRLCSDCLRKLQWNLGFDIKARLEKIRTYFAKHKLDDDYRITVEDLKAIEY